MYSVKANILFLLKIATDLLSNGDNLDLKYYKQVFRAFKKYNKTGEHFYYKVYLSDSDLERFDIKYLFYQNELKKLETTYEVLRIGDIFREHKLYYDWKKARTFDDVILFKRFLDYDKLYNVLYVNKRQLKFLLDLQQRNKAKWYKIKDNEEEYNIVLKNGCGNSLRNFAHKNKVFEIETEQDILDLALYDVLSVIPVRYKYYGAVNMHGEQNTDINLIKMNELISDFEQYIFWVNDDIKLKFLLAEHLRSVLYVLFESNEDDETVIEDYQW